MGRDSSVGIATRYELNGLKIESRWGRDFLHPSLPYQPLGLPSLLYNGHCVSFPGVKRPRRGVNHPPLPSAEVKERKELQAYFYSSSGPSWPVLGQRLLKICSEHLKRTKQHPGLFTAPDLWSADTKFKSRPDYRLCWLRRSAISSSMHMFKEKRQILKSEN